MVLPDPLTELLSHFHQGYQGTQEPVKHPDCVRIYTPSVVLASEDPSVIQLFGDPMTWSREKRSIYTVQTVLCETVHLTMDEQVMAKSILNFLHCRAFFVRISVLASSRCSSCDSPSVMRCSIARSIFSVRSS